ncbi:oligosaccharide flippase family protein [Prevotella pallens]|uniref:oligosaccharide flippase family protein n=1 Tax=Prevotella pallens TaxID=60133 RepID=UPI0028891EC0|nr:oligosaccharide flippase family protein [Prevotella pallens]
MIDTTKENNKRIAKNTIALFIRMLAIMLISLYTSRLVLKSLGVTDFGIYNVVGGFVAMFSIISNSISSSISRYITYSLGKGDVKSLRMIFSSSLNMLYLICLFLFIILETGGLWFLNFKMVIPEGRLYAANWVFQISLITFFIDIIAMPYNALIIAHERMSVFAYIGIVEALGKLCVALLIAFSPIDRIIYYALLMAVVAVLVRLLYSFYCRRHFEESKYSFIINKSLIKNMFSFAGWNFFGISSSMLADQGVNLILNIFFGPVVNTARGLALQVSGAVTSFSSNFMTALNPQITKSYAADEKEHYIDLVCRGTKFSFFLMYIFALPVIFTTTYLLHFWLGSIPEHTVNFVRLILVNSLFSILSNTLVTLLMATGKIKTYQILVGGFRFIILPIDYVLLINSFPPESVFFVTIIVEMGCLWFRLYRLKVQIDFPIKVFVNRVLILIMVCTLLSCLIPYFVYSIVSISPIADFFIVSTICLLSSITCIYWIGLTLGERVFFVDKVKRVILKLYK